MTDFWQLGLYDKIYASAIAVDAELASAGGVTATVRVTDKTSGEVISGGPGQAESVRPVCRVRAAELTANGIATNDLTDSTITFNDRTWRVKAVRALPSPMGEDAGEIMLILLSES